MTSCVTISTKKRLIPRVLYDEELICAEFEFVLAELMIANDWISFFDELKRVGFKCVYVEDEKYDVYNLNSPESTNNKE